MAETELKAISSGSADVIVEVEEEAPLSNDKDDVSSYVAIPSTILLLYSN